MTTTETRVFGTDLVLFRFCLCFRNFLAFGHSLKQNSNRLQRSLQSFVAVHIKRYIVCSKELERCAGACISDSGSAGI